MNEPIAYLNGRIVPVSQAALSVFDLGVVAGASATEMIRTFRHKLFRLDEHLDRLQQSLRLLEIDPGLSRNELVALCHRVVEENSRLIPAEHDLGLVVFVTAGQNLTYLGRASIAIAKTPSVCVHTFPLPFELWADKYDVGLHLVTTSVRSPLNETIPFTVKHRNRLHWQIADREARRIDPLAMAVMVDGDGFLTETGTGNLCVVEGKTILTPEHDVLHGISRGVAAELAQSLGITFAYGRVSPEELSRSSEAFLTSTTHCLLPVTRFNQQPIGNGRPGPVFQQMISAWGELVGVDIVDQMVSGAKSRSAEA